MREIHIICLKVTLAGAIQFSVTAKGPEQFNMSLH